jgi:hypothetical protein
MDDERRVQGQVERAAATGAFVEAARSSRNLSSS